MSFSWDTRLFPSLVHTISNISIRHVLITVAVAAVFVSMVITRPTDSAFHEVDWIQSLAKSGDAGAAALLGLAYRDGRYGLSPDARASQYWLERAAKGGDPYAMYVLSGAKPSTNDVGTPINRFAQPYLKAAPAISGLLTEIDPRSGSGEALRKRAEAGDANAAYQLAMCYRDGSWDVPKDPVQYHRWLLRAAQGGDQLAEKALTVLAMPSVSVGAPR